MFPKAIQSGHWHNMVRAPAVNCRQFSLFVHRSGEYWVDEMRDRLKDKQFSDRVQSKSTRRETFSETACNLQSHPPSQVLTLFHEAALLLLLNCGSCNRWGIRNTLYRRQAKAFTGPRVQARPRSQAGLLPPPHALSRGKVWLVLSDSSAFFPWLWLHCICNFLSSFLVYVITQFPNVVQTASTPWPSWERGRQLYQPQVQHVFGWERPLRKQLFSWTQLMTTLLSTSRLCHHFCNSTGQTSHFQFLVSFIDYVYM